ncbi:class Ib ribonucleoside-diphosphate reductase assembly flavoprotein NrdI [Fructobacillus sp. M1-13]|uniref:Class Ib ribonucleoside-diphosphate reductase assembly flavoprotein NrdI n=1 Tax=Fructobacillus papyriferae TaxID=2713171 RepID=A0ABS5QQY3_9LACO|nr:class Ib ribonucleoside-diphosphate reductase assembly flavoprotein NrdI [Fructobacillus papyriferae]MBS9335332.1 class Ib ribonucleoside-diphosphate reductase assembly flavoprotein NrdI [Fructobacillus papyriferae]MCD2158999.1 class Ib ribonucleoside-diphosphate reductase assembly flavoprotein NrdI [Fructobacillus papyriferae]
MTTYRLLYTSIEGNTDSFVKKLAAVAAAEGDKLSVLSVGDEVDPVHEKVPYVVLVPTYLNGGTGTGPEVKEIFTNGLGEYIEYGNNQRYLRGVIGSGNRNFNDQYVLTAKRYAQKYHVPLLGDYELRGTQREAEKLFTRIKETLGE